MGVLFAVVDLDARPVRLAALDEREMDRIDLVGVVGGDVLAEDGEADAEGLVDHGPVGHAGRGADEDLLGGLDGRERFDPAAEVGTLFGREIRLEPEEDSMNEHGGKVILTKRGAGVESDVTQRKGESVCGGRRREDRARWVFGGRGRLRDASGVGSASAGERKAPEK